MTAIELLKLLSSVPPNTEVKYGINIDDMDSEELFVIDGHDHRQGENVLVLHSEAE